MTQSLMRTQIPLWFWGRDRKAGPGPLGVVRSLAADRVGWDWVRGGWGVSRARGSPQQQGAQLTGSPGVAAVTREWRAGLKGCIRTVPGSPGEALGEHSTERLLGHTVPLFFTVTLPSQHGFVEWGLAVWWISHQGRGKSLCRPVVPPDPFTSLTVAYTLFNQNPDLVLLNFFQLKTEFFSYGIF